MYIYTHVANNIGAILVQCCVQYWRNNVNYIGPILRCEHFANIGQH